MKLLLQRLSAIVFWIIIWEVIAVIVNKTILLPTPAETFLRMIQLVINQDFWLSIIYSIARMSIGIIIGCTLGVIFGCGVYFSKILRILLYPLREIIKATPVASFIILALIWFSKQNVPAFSAAVMVCPIVWQNVSTGLQNTDNNLIELAKIYNFNEYKKLKFLYLPSVKPYFFSSLSTSIGLGWKAGIAAEVLSGTKMALGNHIYDSKIYLETPDLFCWTITVILISMIIEKTVIYFTYKKHGGAEY